MRLIDDARQQMSHFSRSKIDRRKKIAPLLSRYRLMGRRAAPRRRADREKPYTVDRHGPKTVFMVLVIILLSIADAALTLYLIAHGASEINPVMAYFLNFGPGVFFCVKYLFTAFAVLIILVNGNGFLFGTRLRVNVLFFAAFIPFLLVILWELYLCLFVI